MGTIWHAQSVSRRLVVLGSCGAWPEPSRACSGFVLELDGFRIVLDLGYGTLPRLLELLGSAAADGLDAVVITHHHPDHALDLHGLFRARWFGRRGASTLPLYAPWAVLDQVAGLEEDDGDAVPHVFDWHPVPAAPYQVGPIRLESWSLPHFVPNAGVRLSTPDLTVAYTGDTGPDPALVDLGRNADLYIMEASDRHQQDDVPQAVGPHLHLNAVEAGRAAAAANADRLLLTHFWPGNDRDRTRADAAAHFPGSPRDPVRGGALGLSWILGESAVGVDVLPGDPAVVGAGQEGDEVGDVGGLADPAQGGHGGSAVECFGWGAGA